MSQEQEQESSPARTTPTTPTTTSRSHSWIDLAWRLIFGQFLAACVAMTGLFSSLLAQTKTSVALLQSTSAYGMIVIILAPIHISFCMKRAEREKLERVERMTRLRQQQQQQRVSNNSSSNTNNENDVANNNADNTTCIDDETAASSNTNNNNISETLNKQEVVEDEIAPPPCYQNGIQGYFVSRFSLWKYFVLAIIDSGASYFAIKAYSFTDITSAQLLDASTIFTVMILGYFFLARRFNAQHFIGIILALGGMVGLVFLDADDDSRNSQKTAPKPVLGDVMTLVGSVLYGFSNIGNEMLLKSDKVAVPVCLKNNKVCGCCFDSDDKRKDQQEMANRRSITTPITTTVASASASAARGNSSDTIPIVDADSPRSPLSSANNNNELYSTAGEVSNNNNNQEQEEHQEQEQEEDDEEDADTSWAPLDEVFASLDLITDVATFNTLFGFCISFLLLLATQIDEVKDASAHWTWHSTLYQIAFCCVMVGIYIGMPFLLKLTNATFVCLSLLTADVYAVVLNYITSGTAPTGLYYITAVGILIGVLLFDTAERRWFLKLFGVK